MFQVNLKLEFPGFVWHKYFDVKTSTYKCLERNDYYK